MYQERYQLFSSRVILFVNGERALPAQKREKLQGVNLFLHFSRENFEGLEQTRGYLSHNMRVMRFWYNNALMASSLANNHGNTSMSLDR